MPRIGPSELSELIRAIDGYDGDDTPRRRAVTRAALLFTLLTWARTNETRHARWKEFEDLNGASPLWRVTAERMKMAREHVVPLAPAVVALLSGAAPSLMGAAHPCALDHVQRGTMKADRVTHGAGAGIGIGIVPRNNRLGIADLKAVGSLQSNYLATA